MTHTPGVFKSVGGRPRLRGLRYLHVNAEGSVSTTAVLEDTVVEVVESCSHMYMN